MLISKTLYRRLSRLVWQPYSRLVRGMTLGARVAVLGPDDGSVLLVQHTYTPGWLLPGGGVDRGETLLQAAVREVREEAGIIAEEEPRLHGIFSNEAVFPGDHVAVYVLRAFHRLNWSPSAEIAAAEFFPVTALPEDTTRGTRRRLAEILEGRPADPLW